MTRSRWGRFVLFLAHQEMYGAIRVSFLRNNFVALFSRGTGNVADWFFSAQ